MIPLQSGRCAWFPHRQPLGRAGSVLGGSTSHSTALDTEEEGRGYSSPMCIRNVTSYNSLIGCCRSRDTSARRHRDRLHPSCPLCEKKRSLTDAGRRGLRCVRQGDWLIAAAAGSALIGRSRARSSVSETPRPPRSDCGLLRDQNPTLVEYY